MKSFFAKLFLDIQERIKTEVPEIQWIEQDFGQDAFDKWRPNVAFPAVLIDFTTGEYSEMGGIDQLCDVAISIRLFVAPFSQSYEDAPIDVREDALGFFDLESDVCKALHGWTPNIYNADNYCQALIRKRVSSNNRNDIGLRIRDLVFTTQFEETF